MQDISSLMDAHEAMDSLADQLVCQARPGGGSAQDCRALLRRLKAGLAAHGAAEASFLTADPDGAAADPFEAELRSLGAGFSALSESWKAYFARWTRAAIAADRPAFAQETADMMTAFKLRIEHENRVTYPLALKTGRIIRRAA